MSSLISTMEQEFEKLQQMDGMKIEFIEKNKVLMRKIFGYIFVLNYLKNKAETKRYFNIEFHMTFSLLLESIYALLSGQCRAALLLLRSAQEANYKFVLERERQLMLDKDPTILFESLDYRFGETKRKFAEDLHRCLDDNKFKEYFTSLDRGLTLYKELSAIVHSGTKSLPVISVEYFSHLHEETIIDSAKFFELFISVMNNIFILNYFMLRESLQKWDYYSLYNLLNLLHGDKRTKTLISIVKHN